jgi:pyridoxal phosphate enzyme (YggS family)
VTQITDHIAETLERVRFAQSAAGRAVADVTVLAVSKQQPVAAIRAAYQAGLRNFGENFFQEAAAKIAELEALDITWHFIGRIQSNKTRDIAELFQWVHTVDRLKIATRLNDQRPHFSPPLNVCIQVNQAGESQKGGVEESEVAALARAVMSLPRLRLRGLMTLPPATPNPETNAPLFARLNTLKAALIDAGIPLDTLSMGMSADLEAAIGQGSTIVRIGTAIFGPRQRTRSGRRS